MNESPGNDRRGAGTLWAVIPAAGGGTRMGADRPKQYLPLAGKTVLRHVLERFARHPRIAGIVVALAANDPYWEDQSRPRGAALHTVTGGAERCESVLNALRYLRGIAEPGDWVLVHDAARPCLRPGDLDRLISTLAEHPVGGLLGTPVPDTLKRVDENGTVSGTFDRTGIWRALTPQMFRLGMLLEALEAAIGAGVLVTDEAAAIERAGHAPRMVEGSPDNLKITTAGDLPMAELILGRQILDER